MGLRNRIRGTVLVAHAIKHLRAVRTRRTQPHGVIPDLPKRVIVEPTNACNLRCSYCGNKDMVRPWTYMPMPLYEQLLDEMRELGIPRITLHTIGESTLHPRIVDMIRLAKQAGLVVTMSTNGTRLDEELCRGIVHAGPDILSISVDSADPDVLREVREGIDPDALYAGMARLRRVRDAEGPEQETPWGRERLPSIVANAVLTPHWDREQERAYFEKYGPLVDDVFFHWPNNHASYVRAEPHRRAGLLPRKVKDWLYKRVRYPCPYPWDALFLLSDATISVCRFDFDARVNIGRYGEHSIRELWHGQRMMSLRRAHMAFDFREWSTCEDCTGSFYENRHEHYSYSQKLKRRNGFQGARNAWLAQDPMRKRALTGSGTVQSDVG